MPAAPVPGDPAPDPIRLRPASAADRELLYRIYASTRAEELASVDWSPSDKEAFLRMQFEAQDRHYREHYAGAEFLVVLAGDEPAGRLYVERREDEIRIVDVALLEPYRGKGIGGALVRDLLDEAGRSGKPVRIHVERLNPALRLYARLGFRQVADRGVYLLMERAPGDPAARPA
jgi:GNAT superfamily N-acetyltransferase